MNGHVDGSSGRGGQRTFLGHPIGLYVLFFTEMWERFSYYGMRALLITYMVNYFKWSQKDASTTYKVYTSFVYVTPILGGYLADRYLGNKRAVIIGAILMAIGHFLMASETYAIFLSALIFLILGNGMFKPNMSTQVGRLYPANDGRRDGAYTIFYMGINLGAFMSPLVCGWLQENTVGGHHSGFTMAGIGMVVGLLIYLLGQPLVREIDANAAPPVTPPAEAARGRQEGSDAITTRPAAPRGITTGPATPEGITTAPGAKADGAKDQPLTEAEADRAPSILGGLAAVIPVVLAVLGVALLGAAPALWALKRLDQWDSIMLGIGGVCLLLMAYVCGQVHGGMRDRVFAILTLGIFVMFFWAAFEQAGNVLNLWADKSTDRYLTQPTKAPDLVPVVVEDAPRADGGDQAPATVGLWERFRNMFRLKPRPEGEPEKTWGEWLTGSLNPVPTAWFQSINALAIFVLAPFFAWMWVVLDRRGWQPSIPMKMVFGLLMMSASMAVMIAAARQENKVTSVTADAAQLPAGITAGEGGKVGHTTKEGAFEPFHAGRLTFDARTRTLEIYGVLPDNERDNIIEATAPDSFKAKVEELAKKSEAIDDKAVKSAAVKLDEVPPGFDMKYAGLKKSVVEYRAADHTLVAYKELKEKETKGLLVAAGEPQLRGTLNKLFLQSNQFQVSAWWLFWSYILATLGELCLSPVGLSMVSKLAPAKFATMLMGVWLLTSAFGNFAAGALGEIWGTVPPIQFFLLSTVVVGGSALVLLVLVRVVRSAMHGVN